MSSYGFFIIGYQKYAKRLDGGGFCHDMVMFSFTSSCSTG